MPPFRIPGCARSEHDHSWHLIVVITKVDGRCIGDLVEGKGGKNLFRFALGCDVVDVLRGQVVRDRNRCIAALHRAEQCDNEPYARFGTDQEVLTRAVRLVKQSRHLGRLVSQLVVADLFGIIDQRNAITLDLVYCIEPVFAHFPLLPDFRP